MIIGVSDKFDASHHLPCYEGKCSNIHGHTWHVELMMLSTQSPSALQLKDGTSKGMVMDFNVLKNALRRAILQLDHNNLNDIVANPTCEALCEWMGKRLHDELKSITGNVIKVRIKEGEGGWAETDWM